MTRRPAAAIEVLVPLLIPAAGRATSIAGPDGQSKRNGMTFTIVPG